MKNNFFNYITIIIAFVFAILIGISFAQKIHFASSSDSYAEKLSTKQMDAISITTKKENLPKYIKFNVTKKTVTIGSNYTVRYKLSENSDSKITWYSNNSDVAVVNDKGTITAKGVGSATIIAKTLNNKKAKIEITVKPKNKTITFARTSYTINKGDSFTLNVSYTPANSYEKISWSTSNQKVVKVNKKGVVTALKNGEATITATTSKGKKTATCKIIVNNTKYIALTFDDGPVRTNTTKLLDGLKKQKAYVTFFMVGYNIPGNEDLLKRMKKEGHELGSHSYSHSKLTTLSNNEIVNQITQTNSLIRNAVGSYATVFRPPYGSYNDMVLYVANAPIILWSVDTLDWKYKNKKYVKKQIVDNAYDGAIILLHDLHATSVDGAIAAIKTLKKQGYEFVTVSELFEIKGMDLTNGNVYRYRN